MFKDELDKPNLEKRLRELNFGYRARYIQQAINYLKYTINDITFFNQLKSLKINICKNFKNFNNFKFLFKNFFSLLKNNKNFNIFTKNNKKNYKYDFFFKILNKLYIKNKDNLFNVLYFKKIYLFEIIYI